MQDTKQTPPFEILNVSCYLRFLTYEMKPQTPFQFSRKAVDTEVIRNFTRISQYFSVTEDSILNQQPSSKPINIIILGSNHLQN